ncbi:hypothetical protein PCIT_a3993 [Pseudoalteromonas citrea]|uniref:Uncharacterized protein n=2 Tax=Pseudoalteromonas citrea TaxID=43655 RepID=A0AAD4AIL6_9GAMM|nr:hypothetical protein [Pseudoalteromonas citrea]KAF7771419.1 hypothetical protein PCIT_a3993 [Pseudoalteromonas citrea]
MSEDNINPYIASVSDGFTLRHPNFESFSIWGETGKELVQAYNDLFSRYNGSSPYSVVRTVLLQMPDFAQQSFVDFKSEKSVTDFLYGFRTHIYTTSNLKASLPTRNNYWMAFRLFIEFAMQEKVIAKGLIPPGNRKLNNRNVTRKNQLTEKLNGDNPIDNKTVINISLSRTEDEYLDELEQEFRAVKNAFMSAALKEINDVKEKYLKGRELASEVNWCNLRKKLNDAVLRRRPFRDKDTDYKLHLFSHNHPNFLPNCLCYIFNNHDGLFLGYENCGLGLSPDLALKYLSKNENTITSTELDGYLGRVTSRILVPFFVYFLLKFPNFRMYSLLNAEIESESDSSTTLTSVGEDNDVLRFTIDKARAHEEKSGYLDKEAQEILNLLIDLTTPFRNKLKHDKNPKYKKLWLVVNGGDSFGVPRAMNHKSLRRTFGLNARHIESGRLARNDLAVAKKSFLASHEELKNYITTTTIKKLPVIQGIITWFDTLGDAAKAAKVLGNTKKMAMDSYIPKPIQHLMNVRIIRRFQNLIICAATAGKDYMLEAADFNNTEELNAFLTDMLLGEPEGAKDAQHTLTIKEILNQKLRTHGNEAERLETSQELDGKTNQVKVSISVDSLAALFLYEEHIDANDINLPPSQDTNCPTFWRDLAKTLHRLLPEHPSNRELSYIYHQSLIRTDELRDKVTFPKFS